VIIAEGKSPMGTSKKVVEAAKALAERLSTLSVLAEIRRCDEPGGCGITALRTVKAQPLKVTKAPAALMLASSVIPLVLSLIFAPNVFTLVLGLLLPPLFAAYLSLRVASSMRVAGSASPLEGEAEFVEGRLRIGNTYYSFAALRKVEHSDRFVEPETSTGSLRPSTAHSSTRGMGTRQSSPSGGSMSQSTPGRRPSRWMYPITTTRPEEVSRGR